MKLYKFNYKAILIFLSSFFMTSGIIAQQPIYVGIPSNQIDYFSASQFVSQWCWAASVQMVLNGYGVNIRQDQIIERTYGRNPFGDLPNWFDSIPTIHRNLNNWRVDNFGDPYTVMAQIGNGAPSPSILINELSNGHPVIIGYRSEPNIVRTVVVTAVSYIPTSSGPHIQTIVVRDPCPSEFNIRNRGRVEYPAAVLANKIHVYWYVRVVR